MTFKVLVVLCFSFTPLIKQLGLFYENNDRSLYISYNAMVIFKLLDLIKISLRTI